MTFTYRLSSDASGWLAECVESEVAGEGKTSEEALESLRTSLEERMFRPDAVAPPSETLHSKIELVLASDASPTSGDLSGPGG